MNTCKACSGGIVDIADVTFDHVLLDQRQERRDKMRYAHALGYHLGCFENEFDPFKQCLLKIKAERKNENRD